MRQRLQNTLLLLGLGLSPLCAGWDVGQDSRATLNGDSTVTKWTASTEKVHGQVSLPWTSDQIQSFMKMVEASPKDAQKQIEAVLQNNPPKVEGELKIKIEELRSDNKRMQRDMREALKSKKHPWIVYRLETIRGISLPDEKKGKEQAVLKTTGTLSLSGTTKEVELDFNLSSDEQGVVLVSEKTFRMTEFGITPPRALLGMIKAHDDVDIHYRIQLVPKPDQEEEKPETEGSTTP